MAVSGQQHAPAVFLPGMGYGNHCTGSSVGPKEWPDILERGKNLLPLSSKKYANLLLKLLLFV